jgi:hypothetical protein
MEVLFPANVSKVGFWLLHGSVTLQLRDSDGNTHTTGDFEVTGTAPTFIGLSRASADIRVAAIIPSTEAFTIDDFTFAGGSSAPPKTVPETGGLVELAWAAGFLWTVSRKWNMARVLNS